MASSVLSKLSEARAVLRARYYLRSAETMGPRVRLWGVPAVKNLGRLLIGDRVRITSKIAQMEIGIGPEGTLEIGDNVLINYGCSFGATKLVRIGDHCNIGMQVVLIDNSFHELDPDRRDQQPEPQPVILERNVWLASRVMVLPGVTIGENSVIGAGSVVTKDIPPNVLAAGMPAKVIRSIRGEAQARQEQPGAATRPNGS